MSVSGYRGWSLLYAGGGGIDGVARGHRARGGRGFECRDLSLNRRLTVHCAHGAVATFQP